MEELIFFIIIVIITAIIFLIIIKSENQNNKDISKVIILTSESSQRKKAGSSIARGMVGGALFGPVGALGGAMSGKNHTSSETTFLIEYTDGTRKTKKVSNNSKEFEELCKYIEM